MDFFNVLSLLCGLLGAIMAVYVLITAFSGQTVAGWASLMMSIWLLGGLQLVALGVIGEYIARIYIQGKHRPLYIAKEYRGYEEE